MRGPVLLKGLFLIRKSACGCTVTPAGGFFCCQQLCFLMQKRRPSHKDRIMISERHPQKPVVREPEAEYCFLAHRGALALCG